MVLDKVFLDVRAIVCNQRVHAQTHTRMEVEEDSIYMRENADLRHVLSEFERDEASDAEAGATPQKRMRLELNRGESVHKVPRLSEGEPPREDGYVDSAYEKRHAAERPYNREYLQQQLARMRSCRAIRSSSLSATCRASPT